MQVLNVFIIGITLWKKHTEHQTTVSHTQLLVKQILPNSSVITHLFLSHIYTFLKNQSFANDKPKKCKIKTEDAVLFISFLNK